MTVGVSVTLSTRPSLLFREDRSTPKDTPWMLRWWIVTRRAWVSWSPAQLCHKASPRSQNSHWRIRSAPKSTDILNSTQGRYLPGLGCLEKLVKACALWGGRGGRGRCLLPWAPGEDKNGDGSVSSEEMSQVLKQVNPKFTEAISGHPTTHDQY